jgi:hypothetical protein
MVLSGPAFAGPFLWDGGQAELGKASIRCLPMIYRDLEGRGGSRHYSRWAYPWRPEDDWGPLTAAVMFLIILAGLVIYGGVQL